MSRRAVHVWSFRITYGKGFHGGYAPSPAVVPPDEKPHLTLAHHANSYSFLSSRPEVTSSRKPTVCLPVLSVPLCFQSSPHSSAVSLHCGLESSSLTLANSRKGLKWLRSYCVHGAQHSTMAT